MSEHDEQSNLIQWANAQKGKYPELALLFAIPNGDYRHISVAKRLKAEGVRSGVPDLFFPVPRGTFHGLFIEMKFKKNKVSDNQQWWIINLKEQGYCVFVCYSFEEAKDVILSYLNNTILIIDIC